MIDYNTRLLYLMKFFGALTMRYRFRMKDPVNPEALNNAMQKTMKRYPYLAKKIVVRNGAFMLEENELPVPVLKTRTPMPAFGSKELNYHLICADYEGNDICFTILHNLGGGRGLFRWTFSVLYQYIWELTGKDPMIEGIRRPDQPPEPGEELIQPFLTLPDITPVWEGFPPEVKPIPQSKVEEMLKEDKPEGAYVTALFLDEEKVMERVKAIGASPSVWFAILYFKALLRCIPEVPEYTDLGITCDVSDQYGFAESMSLITKFMHLIIKKEEAGQDIETLCKKGRAELKSQRDPGATNELFKKERETLIRMEECPTLNEKAKYYLEHSLIADMTPSTLVSYVGQYEIPGMDRYIEQTMVKGFNATNGIVITAQNGRFVPELAHKYKDAKIIRAFEEELAAEGIEVLSAERNMEQNNFGVELPEE